MYSPDSFKVDDPAALAAFMAKHNFATIVTHDGQAPRATHMPVLLDRERGPQGTLISHMARANPLWRQFENVKKGSGCKIKQIIAFPFDHLTV